MAAALNPFTHISRRVMITPEKIMPLQRSLERLLPQREAQTMSAKVRSFADQAFRGLADAEW